MAAWIPRTLAPKLIEAAKQRPAVLLTGARQTGKTSLVRHSFPDYHYVTLDLPSEAEQAEQDPEAFFKRHPAPLIIDEAQYAPKMFRHIKVLIDGERQKKGRYILTGSQKFALMREASESLAGRVAVFELHGLSMLELRGVGRKELPENLGLRGFLPELWENPRLSSTDFFQAYVSTYLERDLRLMLEVGSLRDFERFIRACALRTAQVLNKAELARDIGISPSTAGAWLSVLEASNQIVLLEPWFSNKTKSLTKSPKLYWGDTGMLAYLLGIRDEKELLNSPFAGAFWETLACIELHKQLQYMGRGPLLFWRDRTKEADFLLHQGGRFTLFDAKWSQHPSARDAQQLEKIAAELPKQAVHSLNLICRAPNAYPIGKAQALPLEEALNLLEK